MANAATLGGMKRIKMLMRDGLIRIGESKEAACEVRPGIACKFEQDRFGSPFDPDFAAHDAFDTTVDFSAHHAVVNPKRHARIMGRPMPDDKIDVACRNGASGRT